jgi:RNA polymerase sigma-70 factor (ECF subfamily)
MDKPLHADDFIRQLTAAQTSLYAYILTLLPDRAAAQDVLQETNLTLWRKLADFQPGTSFMAWGCRVAYFQVLNHRRRMKRDRLVFDDQLLDSLAERQAERMEQADHRELALKKCLESLPAAQRSLIQRRYAPDGSVQEIAEAEGKSAGAISQMLYRIREALLNCIQGSLAIKETS